MISALVINVLLPATLVLSAVLAAAGEDPAAHAPAKQALSGGTIPAQPSPGLPGAENLSAKPPLWSFVWLSDMHLDGSRLEYTAKALQYINAELQPHFVLLTGDNNAHAAPPADPRQPEPRGVGQQRFLKAFLEQHLKRPYVLLTADNWTAGFDTVFGPHQSSFDCGGLHFLLLDPDRVHHGSGAEGLSVFDERTWEWLRRDLDRHRDKPTIVALHEPLVPPTFLDAPRLRALLDRQPQVVAALQGHLHVDLEFRRYGTAYLVAPSLGRTPSPALKLVQVYPAGIILRTIRDSEAKGRFEMTSRRQEIPIPKTLRSRLHTPPDGRFVKAHYDCVPAHPIVDDPALAARASELLTNALDTLWPAKATTAR